MEAHERPRSRGRGSLGVVWPMSPTSGPTVAVIVAHPDDEILWAGGALLLHPEWRCSLFSLCRASDPDRAPRFERVARALGATASRMADLDDGPEQLPLPIAEVAKATLELMKGAAAPHVGPGYPGTPAPGASGSSPAFDLLITHSPHGEYTRHRRHEEASRAVLALLRSGRITAGELWLFAYEDEQRRRYPHAISVAPLQVLLPEEIWRRKLEIMTTLYGFSPDSWEARTTPATEAFWRFEDATTAALAFDVEGDVA